MKLGHLCIRKDSSSGCKFDLPYKLSKTLKIYILMRYDTSQKLLVLRIGLYNGAPKDEKEDTAKDAK